MHFSRIDNTNKCTKYYPKKFKSLFNKNIWPFSKHYIIQTVKKLELFKSLQLLLKIQKGILTVLL
uniref:Putative ovule protein n=1 Tax=Solanum chacoense TaxID=4108 RepID=A0A0V0I430_SOLCH